MAGAVGNMVVRVGVWWGCFVIVWIMVVMCVHVYGHHAFYCMCICMWFPLTNTTANTPPPPSLHTQDPAALWRPPPWIAGGLTPRSIGETCHTILIKLILDMWLHLPAEQCLALVLTMLAGGLTNHSPHMQCRAFDLLFNLSVHGELLFPRAAGVQPGMCTSGGARGVCGVGGFVVCHVLLFVYMWIGDIHVHTLVLCVSASVYCIL